MFTTEGKCSDTPFESHRGRLPVRTGVPAGRPPVMRIPDRSLPDAVAASGRRAGADTDTLKVAPCSCRWPGALDGPGRGVGPGVVPLPAYDQGAVAPAMPS